jgi:hypothetical protein
MQPAKKNVTKVLSAISMAAAATLAAKSAYATTGVVITPYYGADTSGSSLNGVMIATDSNGDNATWETVNSNLSNPTTTITMPVGDYLFLACDAVVTGDSNPDGGKTTGSSSSKKALQPSYLGLSSVGYQVVSSDATGSTLAPQSQSTIIGTYGGITAYTSTANINDANGATNGDYDTHQTATNNNAGSGVVPNWTGPASEGDITPGSGNAATHGDLGGGNTFGATMATTSGTPQLVAFGGGAAGSASYNAATEVFDSLSYAGVAKGLVTLSPQIVAADSGYWSLSKAGTSTTTQSTYAPVTAVTSQIAALPVLVIDLTASAASSQAIFSLAVSTNVAPTTYGVNEGDLQVTGGNGKYFPGEIQVTPAATSYLTITGFSPEGDEEIYAFDVLVNGTEATPSQISTLINAINGTDGHAPISPAVAAVSGTWLSQLGVNPFPPGSSSPWNLYVDMGNAVDLATGTATYLGWDVSSQDPNLVGYTIEQVGVVPEPMSLGLLALGGVGLMARRNRRKA